MMSFNMGVCALTTGQKKLLKSTNLLIVLQNKKGGPMSPFDVLFSFLMPLKCNRIAIVGLFSACNRIFDL